MSHPFAVEKPPERAAERDQHTTAQLASPSPSPDDAARHAPPPPPPGARRRRWVGAFAVVGAVALAAVGWCSLSGSCPWQQPEETEPYTYGDDPDLDLLWDGCAAGNAAACDQLYVASPASSAYEQFGATCGGTAEWRAGSCSGGVALIAPVPLAPADGSVFNVFPRTTTLVWAAVPGAASYTVEVDCLHCCVVGEWCSDVGSSAVYQGITEASYTFDWVGANVGRWRVWAVGADGTESEPSPWWQFEYTQ